MNKIKYYVTTQRGMPHGSTAHARNEKDASNRILLRLRESR